MTDDRATLDPSALSGINEPDDPPTNGVLLHRPGPCILCGAPALTRWHGRPRHPYGSCLRLHGGNATTPHALSEIVPRWVALVPDLTPDQLVRWLASLFPVEWMLIGPTGAYADESPDNRARRWASLVPTAETIARHWPGAVPAAATSPAPTQPAQTPAEPTAAPNPTEDTPEPMTEPERPAQPAEPEPTAGRAPADAELAAFTRAVVKATAKVGTERPVPDPEAVRAALDLWHEHTGLRFWKPDLKHDGMGVPSYRGEVGVARFAQVRAIAGAPGEAGRTMATHPLVLALNDPQNRDAVKAHDFSFVNPDVAPELGQFLTGLDVNTQYLAASRTDLGTGEPELFDLDHVDDKQTKYPGYVRAAAALPADRLEWRRGLARITAGSWVPMPVVRHIQRDLKIEFPASQALVWTEFGRPLDAWGEPFRRLRDALLGRTDLPAKYALAVNTGVYQSFLGGMLRAKKWNKYVFRPDWADMIEATGWANALRGVGKSDAIPLGMRRDAVWFLADHAPFQPAGIEISMQDTNPPFKAGKWKIERYGPVTDQLIRAHKRGRVGLVNDAIIALDQLRQAEAVTQ